MLSLHKIRNLMFIIGLIIVPIQSVSAGNHDHLAFPVITIEEQDLADIQISIDSQSYFGRYLVQLTQVPQGLAKTYRNVKQALGVEVEEFAQRKQFRYEIGVIEGGASLSFEYRF